MLKPSSRLPFSIAAADGSRLALRLAGTTAESNMDKAVRKIKYGFETQNPMYRAAK
jgi:hypothetical protein